MKPFHCLCIKSSKIEHTRNDYFRESNNGYDMWLQNPDWKVSPKIDFVYEYPFFLIWKDHDGGCNSMHIHCQIWRTNTPSPISDQVFHNVVKPRTANNMKVWYNSTGYKMVEQRGSWKGPDSINVSNVCNTARGSILIQ